MIGHFPVKACNRCGEQLSLLLFPRAADSDDGREATCKGCIRRFRFGLDLLVIYDRDQGRCGICDEPVPWDVVVFDHIVPVAAGGKTTLANLHPAHNACNAFKSKRGLEWARANQKLRGTNGVDALHQHDCPRCSFGWLCGERPCRDDWTTLCGICWNEATSEERTGDPDSITMDTCSCCRSVPTLVHDLGTCTGGWQGADGFDTAVHPHRHWRCETCQMACATEIQRDPEQEQDLGRAARRLALLARESDRYLGHEDFKRGVDDVLRLTSQGEPTEREAR